MIRSEMNSSNQLTENVLKEYKKSSKFAVAR